MGPLLLCVGCRGLALLCFHMRMLESLRSGLAFNVRAPDGCLVLCLPVRCRLAFSEETDSGAVHLMRAVLKS